MNAPQPALIVFLDSLPHRVVPAMPFLSTLPYGPLRPGFGYSMNIKAELFAGLTPENLGVLGSWNPTSRAPLAHRLLGWLAPLDKIPFTARWLRRLGHRAFRRPLAWVPFHLLKYFAHYEVNAYQREFPHPTILQTPGAQRLLYRDFPPGPQRDEALFASAAARVDRVESLLFIASADLDHTGHLYGVGAPAYRDKIAALDAALARLVETWRARFADAPIVVLSDHGMSNVTANVDLAIERRFGPMRPDRYLAALDATMVRFWFRNTTLRDEIAAFLAEQPHVTVLNEAQRAGFGLRTERLGELIALLDEGHVVCPSFYFREPPQGMHGYHPDAPGQTAVFAAQNVPTPLPQSAAEVFPYLQTLLGRENAT
ncbi:MAG TPA: alkaline phosphatase family protein [bacterium]|nr:alkaline phosphatase family protein [bacterium]